MTFAQRLRELRDTAGLTQEGLAQKAGMSVGNVRNYEQSIRLPTFPVVVKLAAALGVTCEVFAQCSDVTGEEGASPTEEAATPKKKPKGKK